jgi:hypothetical protein
MAINQNHLFEELNGIKCAIVEKNVPPLRVDFLRSILEYNRYTVVVVASPPPKVAAVPADKPAATVPAGATGTEGTQGADVPVSAVTPVVAAAPAPETFTVGVTDVIFNATNAIFGRLLKVPGGHVVTLAYWQQKERESHDDVPYFE